MEYVDISPNHASTTYIIPVYRTHPLTTRNENIRRLVLMFGDADRKAWVTFGTIWAAEAAIDAVAKDVVVITPYFTCQQDLNRPEVETRFDCNGWVTGHFGYHPITAYNDEVSSMSAIDSIIRIAQGNFPLLETIVLAGFDAGGELVHRYAMFNDFDGKLKFKFKYVVAAAPVYLYPTQERVRPERCRTLKECILEGRDHFFLPPFSGCPAYNDYRYGLEQLDWNSCYGGQRTRASSSVKQFPYRDVMYFVGERDTFVHDLDTGCEAGWQGGNRATRAMVYYWYVKHVLKGTHGLIILGNMGHSMQAMFAHSEWVKAVFY
ncbi:hypothetical protein HK101_003933 [Irineochytrium annulatum]|nr:hypothetical protein HK101_003933 [Irineochytrium annulatum]